MHTRKRNGNRKDELKREYDLAALKGGVRGKYYERAMEGSNLVLIEPDIAEVFPDSAAVNEALRGVISRKSHAPRNRALTARRNRGTRRGS